MGVWQRNFATPWTIACQASLSMEFSRPEYWGGQPFPSPVDLPDPGIEPRSPTLQADSLPAELQWKPKTIGMGSLSLLQWIFPTQESNPGLLHCRWILYQLSYQGSMSVSCQCRRHRDVGLISGLGKSPGGGHGNPLQYSCLENPHGQRSLAGYSP